MAKIIKEIVPDELLRRPKDERTPEEHERVLAFFATSNMWHRDEGRHAWVRFAPAEQNEVPS